MFFISFQVLQSLIKDRRAKSLNELATYSRDDIDDKALPNSTHEYQQTSNEQSTDISSSRLSRTRGRLAVQRRTSRSLDIDPTMVRDRNSLGMDISAHPVSLTSQKEEPEETIEPYDDKSTEVPYITGGYE